jgi:hypothetical protein
MSAYETIGQLIKASYSNLGIVDVEGDLSPAQYAQGLQTLNAMIGSWSKKRLVVNGIVKESFPTVVGQSVYTIGSASDFTTARPMQIVDAFIRKDGIDYPCNIITREQYNSIIVKTTQARPVNLYYEPLYPVGVIRLYFVPDEVYTLFIDSQKVITSFATAEDAILLPPEYEEAIEYSLTVRLSPKVNVPVSREVMQIATSSYGVINMQPVEPARFDGSFGTRGRYNIYSDSY